MLVNVELLLDKLHEDRSGDDTFLYLFPHVSTQLATYKQDKNCSCREKIGEAFEERPDLAERLANVYWHNARLVMPDIKTGAKPRSRVIEADPNVFDQLIATIPRDTYSGVLVVPNADLVSWTILFY